MGKGANAGGTEGKSCVVVKGRVALNLPGGPSAIRNRKEITYVTKPTTRKKEHIYDAENSGFPETKADSTTGRDEPMESHGCGTVLRDERGIRWGDRRRGHCDCAWVRARVVAWRQVSGRRRWAIVGKGLGPNPDIGQDLGRGQRFGDSLSPPLLPRRD